jgi:alkylation response protein AidB-like acyl-CoA dehydrogenase
MDLGHGKAYEAFRQEVRVFLQANWPPQDASGQSPGLKEVVAFRELATAQGYLRRSIPKQYGGSEQPADEIRSSILREQFSKHGAPLDPPGIGTMMLVPTLLDRGEQWQKEKFIPPTMTGEIRWCQGYSEPSAGSDLASVRTRGVLDGDQWVINGQKVWTSGAQNADYMFCLVRTEPEAPKHRGISYLLFDMKQPGVEVLPLRQMTGTADFTQVFLDNVRTPKDWIVGERGEGWSVSRTTLTHERNSLGAAEGSRELFQSLLELARSTQRCGRPNIEDPSIRQRLAELEGDVRAHECSGYRQLTRIACGKDPGIIGLMNKVIATNIGHKAAKLALDLIGDDALLEPLPTPWSEIRLTENRAWVNQYMISLGLAVAGGTANIQRNVIAERGLGLPRDLLVGRSSKK